MADGTSVPVGVMTPAMAGTRRAGSMKRFTQRRSTIAFLLCLPLILLVAGFVIYPAFYAIYLSMLNKKMTAFVGLGNFAFLLKRHTFQLVIFQSCLFAITSVVFKALIGFILAHLMHNIPRQEPAHLARPAAGAVGDPAGAVHADLVVDVRSVLLGVQLDPEPVRLRQSCRGSAWAGSRGSAPSRSMSGSARRSS